MAEKKRWLEIALGPLVGALVGVLGTFIVTSLERKSAEAREAA